MYIWQSKNWPNFIFQQDELDYKLENVIGLQKKLIGRAKDLPENLDQQAEMDALIQNVLQTSEIEGEHLDAGSVRSSVARQLGLSQAGLPVATKQTDRMFAKAENTTIRFYSLSASIQASRNAYYDILQRTQSCETEHQKKADSCLDVTEWIEWFLDCLIQALQQGLDRIKRVIVKANFWQVHSQTVLTERQVKVLNRLLDFSGEQFAQGINAGKYKSLARISKATATRDLTDLVEKGCLIQLPAGGRSTRYTINSKTFRPEKD